MRCAHRRAMNAFELTGRARTHVVQHDAPRCAAHPEALRAFLNLRAAAALDGFDIRPVSSFRDFATQCRIWNQKFLGERPLYDRDGEVIDHAALTQDEIVTRILAWSAIPGGSRHHWGSEFDVVDMASVPADYHVRLLPKETRPGGVFHQLHEWLDENMTRFDFFRPYARHQGGVLPEPWHISYEPVASPALTLLTVDVLREALVAAALDGGTLLLARLPALYESHVRNISSPGGWI